MIENVTLTLRHHKILTPADYVAFARRQVERLRQAGYTELAMHEDDQPKLARIDWGRWLIDCGCGAANDTHPDWPLAACAACGAVHRNVIHPENRAEIEGILDLRPKKAQFWYPHETADQLRAENIQHGLKADW